MHYAKLVHNACCRLCQHDVVYCRVIDRFLHEVIRTFSYYSSDIIVSEWLYHSKRVNPTMLLSKSLCNVVGTGPANHEIGK